MAKLTKALKQAIIKEYADLWMQKRKAETAMKEKRDEMLLAMNGEPVDYIFPDGTKVIFNVIDGGKTTTATYEDAKKLLGWTDAKMAKIAGIDAKKSKEAHAKGLLTNIQYTTLCKYAPYVQIKGTLPAQRANDGKKELKAKA